MAYITVPLKFKDAGTSSIQEFTASMRVYSAMVIWLYINNIEYHMNPFDADGKSTFPTFINISEEDAILLKLRFNIC